MIRISMPNETKYKNQTYKPYEKFLIDDNDKDELVKCGATIFEEKVVNKNWKEEKSVEQVEETAVEVEEMPKKSKGKK